MYSIPQKQSGIVLIEVLVTLGIVVLVGIGVSALLRDTFVYNRVVSDNLNRTGELRRATKTITAELRRASPSSVGAYPVADTGTSTVTFYANVDTDTYKERVRYFLQDRILKRAVLKPSGNPLAYSGTETITELAHNIENSSTTPLFTYYDSLYAGTTTPLVAPFGVNVVRLVRMDMRIDTDNSSTTAPQIQTTQITFRNLKDNL